MGTDNEYCPGPYFPGTSVTCTFTFTTKEWHDEEECYSIDEPKTRFEMVRDVV